MLGLLEGLLLQHNLETGCMSLGWGHHAHGQDVLAFCEPTSQCGAHPAMASLQGSVTLCGKMALCCRWRRDVWANLVRCWAILVLLKIE